MATFRIIPFLALAITALSSHVSACTSSLNVNIGVSEAAQCAYVFSLDESDDGTCPTLQEAMCRWLALQQSPTRTQDMLAHYAFENNPSDSTTNQRHGSTSGQLTYAAGQCGKAAVFDGSSKVVVNAFRNHAWGSQFSVSVWFKRTNPGNYQGIVNTGYYTTGSWEIRMGRGNRGQILGGGVVTADSAVTWNYINLVATVGDWHHTVMTYDGSQLLFYLDNELQSGANDCCHGDIISKNTPLTIGQAGVGTEQDFFFGMIDEVRVFGKALSADEVEGLFKTPCGPTPNVCPGV